MRFSFMKVSLAFLTSILISCGNISNPNRRFKSLNFKSTHIDFLNSIKESDSLNYFTYSYLYMGGGVSTGDINNDGLQDLFFTGNMVGNRLYVNKGDMQFEDISEKAGITGDLNDWNTGTTMADVNNDGFIDIYVCVSGKFGDRKNKLYINQKDSTFKEVAAEWNIDDTGYSVQATFFDYDNDGDLDLYVANYPPTSFNAPNFFYRFKMSNPDPKDSDKLYRNENSVFVDVTNEAGLENYSLGLSATVSDINNDGWKDLYVSNDFASPDFMYLNNQDGTFSEVIKDATKQTAQYGMGVDIADINNDGLHDILEVDMSPANNRRSKANMASMNPSLFWGMVNSGFHYQYMQNNLQLNNGLVNDGMPHFSNISRFSGLSSTDWSWGPLMADFDNDGLKDIFITNGTRREINNKDYFKSLDKSKNKRDSLLQKSLMIPSEKIDNFIFKNTGDLTFEKKNEAWGLEYEGFSNGAAYADLDNDGDLDLIINNIDDYASVFENTSANTNFINISFKNFPNNSAAVGTKVEIITNDQFQMQELTNTRGFQSSVDNRLHFGLEAANLIDTLKITWPNGQQSKRTMINANQFLVVDYNNEIFIEFPEEILSKNLLFDSFRKDSILVHKHTENIFDDFKKQVLLPHKLSNLGPAIAVADVNNDGKEDLFVGGATKQKPVLYLQNELGFVEKDSLFWQKEANYEDIAAEFVDMDSDGDFDLLVSSGGYEFQLNDVALKDRLYINDGKGGFTKEETSLSAFNLSTGIIRTADFDKDGKIDVFVGGRLIPGNYPKSPSSYLFQNTSENAQLDFKEVSENSGLDLKKLGLVTDAQWFDYNNDGWLDLLVVGEWMNVRLFENNEGNFLEVSNAKGLQNTAGWWNTVEVADFDNDGDLDFIAGNLGLNYKYKANAEETFDIYVNDFDENQKSDIVLSYYNDGKQYPVRGRECSSQQIPTIKRKFKNYESYSMATVLDVYGDEKLTEALHLKATTFATTYFENTEDGFKAHPLPNLAQLSAVQDILVRDFNKDGFKDVIIAGNLHESEVETPRNDASVGLLLLNDKNGFFNAIPARESGFFAPKNVKELAEITVRDRNFIIVANNNDYLQLIEIN